MNKSKYRVGVVGATGAVGQEMIRMLEERRFPVASLRALASARSKGRTVLFHGESIPVEVLGSDSGRGLDLVLFSAGAAVSKEYGPLFVKEGCWVIDNSSAWRMEPEIPLVVPEVNGEALSRQARLIANPNCSTIQMVVALKPIHEAARLRRVVVATYQSTSGAGARAMEELRRQSEAALLGKELPPPEKLPATIAFNVIPQIDSFLKNGYTQEEMKMVNETRKIMGLPDLRASATAVRVPVFRAHSEAVWVETEKKLTPEQARERLRNAPGVIVVDEPEKKRYPMPIEAAGRTETFVGRIREDLSCENGLVMWIVADNLLKGAASNAVQIAELLVEKGYL